MGYRSDVAAYFYATDRDKVAFVKLWLKDNLPFGRWHEPDFEEKDDGYLFMVDDVKWYESYADIVEFENIAQTFRTEFCNDADRMAAYEFVRIGEEVADIETEYEGLDCEFRLNVSRAIDVVDN